MKVGGMVHERTPEQEQLFQGYRQRRRDRREQALALRRATLPQREWGSTGSLQAGYQGGPMGRVQGVNLPTFGPGGRGLGGMLQRQRQWDIDNNIRMQNAGVPFAGISGSVDDLIKLETLRAMQDARARETRNKDLPQGMAPMNTGDPMIDAHNRTANAMKAQSMGGDWQTKMPAIVDQAVATLKAQGNANPTPEQIMAITGPLGVDQGMIDAYFSGGTYAGTDFNRIPTWGATGDQAAWFPWDRWMPGFMGGEDRNTISTYDRMKRIFGR